MPAPRTAAVDRPGLFGQAPRRLVVEQVDDDLAGRTRFLTEPGDRRGAGDAVGEDEPGAKARQNLRSDRADAAGRAGDQNGLPVQIRNRSRLPPEA
jgi:hypothetical protein